MTVAAGCGESGSNPVLYSEVLFQVVPAEGGQASFSVNELVAGGVSYPVGTDTVFAITQPFSFFLEGAAPPYRATVVRNGSANITVRAFRNEAQVSEASTTAEKESATVVVMVSGQSPEPLPPTPANPAVRFDVCAPLSTSCSTSGDVGVTRSFTGSLGDPFTTHLVSGFTPAIYFLAGARDNVAAVLEAPSNQELQIQLFINSELSQTSRGVGQVIVQKDL